MLKVEKEVDLDQTPLKNCGFFQSENMIRALCFDFDRSAEGGRFAEPNFPEFFGRIIAHKNNGGFSTSSEDGGNPSNKLPPLEDIFMLICECSNGVTGYIRSKECFDYSPPSNSFLSQPRQLVVYLNRVYGCADYEFAVSIGKLLRAVRDNTDLNTTDTTKVRIHPQPGTIMVYSTE